MPAAIFIPAFNEATTISQVIQGLRAKRPDDEILQLDDALATLPILTHDLLQKNTGNTAVFFGSTTLIIFVLGLLADTISLVSRKDFTNLTDNVTAENEIS